MTIEEARIYADNMTYEDAIYNLAQARCLPYRKATFIKIESLLNDLKELKAYRETKTTDAVDRVTIKEYLDSYNDVPEINVGKIGKDTNVTTTDVVDRQAVNELVDEVARAISDERCCMSMGRSTATIMQDILHLPSVTPQPKMGKWLIKRVGDYDHAICSVCGDDSFLSPEWDALEFYRYCPNCGCKIQEVEE